jgi:hypothetical protein
MRSIKLSRRQILGGLLAGGSAAATMALGFRPAPRSAGPPGPAALDLHALGSRDAYRILGETMRLGKRITLGGTPAAAAPEDDSNIVVIQVKVMAMFISRLIFKFGALADENDVTNGAVLSYTGTSTANAKSTGRYGIPWGPRDADFTGVNDPNAGVLGTFSNGASDLTSFLLGKGIDLVSDVPRWRKLRFNRWWAGLLESGAPEPELGASQLGDATIYPGGAKAFPAGVAVQAFAGSEMIAARRGHAFITTCLTDSPQTTRDRGGDLCHHLDAQNIVSSPLGIVAFASGLDATGKGGFSINDPQSPGARGTLVLGSDLSEIAAAGQPVGGYVDQIQRLIQGGHVDSQLVTKFDELAGVGADFRGELVRQKEALKTAVSNMSTLSRMEAESFFTDPTQAETNRATRGAQLGQGSNTTDDSIPSKAEFLAQCRFVQEAMNIPGLPFRNFVLSVNVNDLNGHPVELASPNFEVTARSLSPLEGMRQLAIGLNMLAQTINAAPNGAKVYVIVTSDGGRTGNMVDSTIAPGLILGPGTGANALVDFLYCDYARMVDRNHPFTVEPGEGPDLGAPDPSAQRAMRAGSMRPSPNPDTGQATFVTETGTADTSGYPSQASVRIGLVRHLEAVAGRGNATSTGGFGSYYRLQTKS